MGHHLTKDGTFKSDKYDWCPPGFFAIKFSDPVGRTAIATYARHTSDRELAEDLIEAAVIAGRKATKPEPEDGG